MCNAAYFINDQGVGIGETTEDYIAAAREFVTTQDSAEFGSPYVDLIYKPMVELLDYLRDNQFQIYICSGGEIDFMRSFAEEYYGIPPQNIIGSALTTKFDDENHDPPVLVRDKVLVQPVNDEGGKPVGIERYVGKKPIMAVGNSNGDLQMLQYTDDGEGPSLMMLVRHNDEDREHYQEADTGVDCSVNDDDNPDNDVDDLPGSYCHVNEVLDEAAKQGWSLIGVKDDFEKVFLGADLS
ncbi:MAG: haloacid dehalogenase-like hydrolase [Hormoscilla sp. GUM202]|nr:haloacid dehalogenase-like hydrolase [Hormoscilla sp. GUM202]